MSNGMQQGFGAAFPTPTTEDQRARQNEIFRSIGTIRSGEPGRFPLDPLDDAAMDFLAQWPTNDQGKFRSTCVAFAVLSMIELQEYLHGRSSQIADYSEEFLYSTMRRKQEPPENERPKNHESGATFMSQAADALEISGICDETEFPYESGHKDPAFVKVPPKHVKNAAQENRFGTDSFTSLRLFLDMQDDRTEDLEEWRERDLVKIITNELRAGNPVSVASPIYFRDNQWTHLTSSGWRYGAVADPVRHEHVVDAVKLDGAIIGAHAVCIVGYREDEYWPEGRFLFRNSWGGRFARKHYDLPESAALGLPRVGYGTLSTKHVADHCWELMFRKRQPDGSLPTQ